MSAGVETWQAAFRATPAEGWLDGRRADALSRFATLGWPSARLEAWRHTSLRKVGAHPWTPARDAHAVQLVGPALPFASALRGKAAFVEAWLGHEHDHAVAALNLAFFTDGAVLDLPAGAHLEAPIEITHQAAQAAGLATATRNLIVLGAGASATVIERWSGAPGERLHTDVTRIHLGPGASLTWLKIVEEGAETTHLATIEASLERDARLDASVFTASGRLARTELRVRLAGPGASTSLRGLTLPRAGELHDALTAVDHAAPNCTSTQHFRAIVAGQATAVFNGIVTVRAGANGTDASQLSRSLLLAEDAEVHTRPQLEIHTDDVKCKHGATVGSLDAEALYFLRARGIGEAEARRLLMAAFVEEWIGELSAAMRVHAEASLERWLSR